MLDRKGECSCAMGCVMTSAQPQPLWDAAVRSHVGLVLWFYCWELSPYDVGGDNIKCILTRPVQVTFMGWGRHSGWHCMHSEFSTNSLGSLREERKLISTVSRDPASKCWVATTIWVNPSEISKDANPLFQQYQKISGQHAAMGNRDSTVRS